MTAEHSSLATSSNGCCSNGCCSCCGSGRGRVTATVARQDTRGEEDDENEDGDND